jgi:hypothetical protein
VQETFGIPEISGENTIHHAILITIKGFGRLGFTEKNGIPGRDSVSHMEIE